MLAKNFFGTLILLLNIIGLGYLFYLGALTILEKISSRKQIAKKTATTVKPKRPPLVIKDSVIPDQDDLLKDMDLSDLDNLNLDDFE